MDGSVKTKRFISKKKTKTLNLKMKNNFTAKNAERERSRVKSLRQAFQSLQLCLPSVPPNTKLSKLDVLILAANYISYLTKLVTADHNANFDPTFQCHLKFLHPIKKWPMRSRLYSMAQSMDTNSSQDPMQSLFADMEFGTNVCH